MTTNWTLEDYKELYDERYAIMLESFTQSEFSAQAQALDWVFIRFMREQNPNDEEILKFRQLVK